MTVFDDSKLWHFYLMMRLILKIKMILKVFNMAILASSTKAKISLKDDYAVVRNYLLNDFCTTCD